MYDSTYDVPKIVKFIQTANRVIVIHSGTGGWKKGTIGVIVHWVEFQFEVIKFWRGIVVMVT